MSDIDQFRNVRNFGIWNMETLEFIKFQLHIKTNKIAMKIKSKKKKKLINTQKQTKS